MEGKQFDRKISIFSMTQMVMWAVNENYDIYTLHSDTQWLPNDKKSEMCHN